MILSNSHPSNMKCIDEVYKLFLQCEGVTTDSREIKKNSMFIALKGANFNGNDYALEALQKGARFAVVDDEKLVVLDERIILVANTLNALQDLARYHRKKIGIPIIAITGTNGKTTTKELIASVLSTTYNILYTQGNLNNHIGVPLTLLRLKEEHQLAVIEMGASKKGDIKELVEIAEPNYGIITNIGTAHLQGFGSLEAIKKTKGELYDYIRENNGIVFVNADDTLLISMSQGIKQVLYSQKKVEFTNADILYRKNYIKLNLFFKGIDKDNKLEVRTNLVGDYNFCNVITAISVGQYFSVKDTDIKRALEEYKPNNSRSQLIQSNTNTIIADAYNANPSSMREAIINFSKIDTNKKKVLIVGDMNELGEQSPKLHIEIKELIEKIIPEATSLYCGKVFSKVLESEQAFLSVKELKGYLREKPIINSFVLVKGSNSINLGEVIESL